MALAHSPKIITDSLTVYLDAANRRSYSGTGSTWSNLIRNTNDATFFNGPAYNSATANNRRNLFVYTEEFDNGIYYRPQALVTQNATTSPRGDSTADFAYANTTTGYHGIVQGFTATAGITYTWSIHVKANQYTKVHIGEGYNGGFYCTVDLATSTITGTGGAAYLSSSISSLDNGWKRISVTFQTGSTYGTSIGIMGYPDSGATLNVYGVQYTGDGTSGVYIWGIQMDVGSVASPYQQIGASFIDTDKIPSFIFDGTNDHAIISNSITNFAWTENGSAGNQNITIDMWVKSTDTNGVFFTKPWNGAGQYNLHLYPYAWYVFNGSNSEQIPFIINLSNGTWINISVWANSTQIGYYINGGQYKDSKNHGLTGGGVPAGGNNVNAGLMTLYPYGAGWGGIDGFSIAGNLSSFKFYNRVLSELEVKQNFNAMRGRFGV